MGFSGADKPLTVCAAVQPTSVAGTHGIFALGKSDTATPFIYGFYNSADLNFQLRDDAGAGTLRSGGTPQTTAFEVVTFVFTGTTISVRVNGVAVVDNLVMDYGTITFNRAAIGCLLRNTAANFFTGYLAEIVWCNTALDVEDVESLEAYIAALAGVTL